MTTCLHDKLNRTHEEGQELQEMILLLLLHFVGAIFLSTDRNFAITETGYGVCLKKLIGDHALRVIRDLNFLELIGFGLQFVDEEIHVLHIIAME